MTLARASARGAVRRGGRGDAACEVAKLNWISSFLLLLLRLLFSPPLISPRARHLGTLATHDPPLSLLAPRRLRRGSLATGSTQGQKKQVSKQGGEDRKRETGRMGEEKEAEIEA